MGRFRFFFDIDETIFGEDVHFLRELLQGHEKAVEKMGFGIDRFYPIYIGEHRNRCFGLQRADGTCSHFAFGKCISKTRVKTSVKDACRRAIFGQILKFKKLFFETGGVKICPINGT